MFLRFDKNCQDCCKGWWSRLVAKVVVKFVFKIVFIASTSASCVSFFYIFGWVLGGTFRLIISPLITSFPPSFSTCQTRFSLLVFVFSLTFHFIFCCPLLVLSFHFVVSSFLSHTLQTCFTEDLVLGLSVLLSMWSFVCWSDWLFVCLFVWLFGRSACWGPHCKVIGFSRLLAADFWFTLIILSLVEGFINYLDRTMWQFSIVLCAKHSRSDSCYW